VWCLNWGLSRKSLFTDACHAGGPRFNVLRRHSVDKRDIGYYCFRVGEICSDQRMTAFENCKLVSVNYPDVALPSRVIKV